MFEFEDDTVAPVEIKRIDASDDKATVTAKLNDNMGALANELAKIAKRGSEVNMTEVNSALALIQETRRKVDESLAVNGANPRGAGNSDVDFKRFLDAAGKPILLARGDGVQEQPGLLDDAAPVINDWHAELRRLRSNLSLTLACLGNNAGPGAAPKSERALLRHLQSGPEEIRRTFSGATNLGNEWFQTLVIPEVWQQLRLPVQPVEDLFPTIEMMSGAVTLPVATTVPRAYRYGRPGAQPTKYAASNIDTDNRSLVSQGMAVMVPVFDDANEDAVIPVLPLIQANMILGLRMTGIDAIINGDTTATHQDAIASWNPGSIFDSSFTAAGVAGGSDDARRCFYGLRKDALGASNSRSGGSDTTVTGASGTLPTAMAALKSPHGASGELVWLVSWQYFIQKILNDSTLLTIVNYGPNATILTGEVGTLYNRVKVVISELLTSDMNASGLYDGVTTTKGGALLFNRTRYIRGLRRDVTSEVDRRAAEGVNYLVVSRRMAFKKVDGTTDKSIHYTYNL